MSTFFKVILVLLVIGLIVWIFQFLWSILPILGIIALIAAVYYAYKAYKTQENSTDFKNNKLITIALTMIAILCFVIPKGPSMQERAKVQKLEEKARKEERIKEAEERAEKQEQKDKEYEQRKAQEQFEKDFQKVRLIEVDYPTITLAPKPEDYRGELHVDLVGFMDTRQGWTELNEEDYNNYVESITTLLKEGDFYLEEKYYHSGEVYYVKGFIWLELPDDPYNPTVDEVMTKSLNGWVLRNGYNAVTTDDEYNPFEEEFKKIENENFKNGSIKRWDRVHDIGKNPDTGEIIKSEE